MGGRPMRDDDPPGCNGGTHIAAAGFPPPPLGENSCVKLFRDFSLVGVVGTCSFEASTSWYLMLLELIDVRGVSKEWIRSVCSATMAGQANI